MTIDELIVEGERLAKPSLLLSEDRSPIGPVAYWGGKGREGHRDPKDVRHRVTIDCGWLSEHGVPVRGSIGVYDVESRPLPPVPIWLDRLPDVPLNGLGMQGGTPLYGQESPSFPPIEALCLYGGPSVDAWLRPIGLDRTDYDQAMATELGQAYNGVYQQRCPLYSDQYAGVLGGWHAMWPDDEFYLPREMRLVLWTLWDSEPWIEVFERDPNLPVRVRTT
jgi:hypothetical protein